MTQTTVEARQQILDELGGAVERSAISVVAFGRAFELLAVGAADRLDRELFRPARRGYARGKRAHAGFAERHEMSTGAFELPPPGPSSQGARGFVEEGVNAATEADQALAALQDSLLPVESGDPELRAGLGEMREALAIIPQNARQLIRGLGR